MDALFTSSQPFDEQPLGSAFYYPTQGKEIAFEDRKQCLSPKMKPHPTNGADMLQPNDFLALSNTLQPDLIPTKDKGLHADSGCSEFEETWPSTDLTGSSKIESPLQHNSSTNVVGSCIDEKVGEPIQRMENYEQKSTIARYIHRFRNEPPKSRDERGGGVGGRGDEFWWTKEPSRSSTPKESDSSTFSPPVRLRDTLKGSGKSVRKPPRSPDTKSAISSAKIMRNQKNITDQKKNDEFDSDVDRMQRRAQKLIDISESTLTSSSSDVPPLNQSERDKDIRPTSPVRQPKKMITNIKTVHQQRVHPEDDILYQWRLARKMEKARQGSGAFSKLPYMRERVFAPTVVNGGESSQGVNTLEKQEMQDLKTTETSSPDIPNDNLNTQGENKSLTGRYRSTEVQTVSPYMHPLIGPINVSCSNVPSHMHAACDILPCSHGNRNKNKTLHGEITCHKQEGMLRNSSCERPVEIAIPVVGLHSHAGSLEYMEEKGVEVNVGDLSTERDCEGEFNYNSQRNHEGRRSLTEPRNDKYNSSVSEQKNKARQKEDEKNKTRQKEDQKNKTRQKEDEKRVDKEFQRGSTGEKEELGSGLDSTVREYSIRKGDAKTRITETIDEVISENLFTGPLSNESSIRTDKSEDIKQGSTEDQIENCDIVGYESSDGEFPDDELLKILRLRRKQYLNTLSQIRTVLNEYPSGKE